ncbi:MAG: SDR family oxidoreductase [Bacteroidetes bacterium]|nr:SDR family oxidoreductase [Bacteroidota bacterium]HET6244683.1 SDR family oxidoreductase [Bacteroidia bacterium]
MIKVLIFGSSGFVGAALVKYMSELGYSVSGCDIINNDEKEYLNAFYFAQDNQESLNEIFLSNYDVCINCAGSASVAYSFENPFKDYELNTRIVFRILSSIKKESPECRFINLSSAAVYGNPASLPIKEEDPVNPVSIYGNHKFMSEMICRQFYDYFKIQTCSLRIFSAYGPGLQKQLFWDMYQKTIKSKSINLFGTGNETRDFIYIKDLVKAIELIVSEKKFKYREINIANGTEVSIRQAAEIFYSLYDPSIKFEFSGEEKPGDPKNWKANIAVLKSFDYKTEYGIEEGIAEYVEWLKKL